MARAYLSESSGTTTVNIARTSVRDSLASMTRFVGAPFGSKRTSPALVATQYSPAFVSTMSFTVGCGSPSLVP